MLEKHQAEYIQKPPKGHHSVKGVGQTHPDPSIIKKIEEVEVPVGKGVPAPGAQNSSLLYNELVIFFFNNFTV